MSDSDFVRRSEIEVLQVRLNAQGVAIDTLTAMLTAHLELFSQLASSHYRHLAGEPHPTATVRPNDRERG